MVSLFFLWIYTHFIGRSLELAGVNILCYTILQGMVYHTKKYGLEQLYLFCWLVAEKTTLSTVVPLEHTLE
jgi:hypothetical protein